MMSGLGTDGCNVSSGGLQLIIEDLHHFQINPCSVKGPLHMSWVIRTPGSYSSAREAREMVIQGAMPDGLEGAAHFVKVFGVK